MEGDILYSSDGFLIEHFSSSNVLKGSFIRCEGPGEYIAAMKAYKEQFEKVKPHFALWDNKAFKYDIHPDVQVWTDTFLNIPCWNMGCTKRVGILIGSETLGISSIVNLHEDGAANYMPRFFLHETEAFDWFMRKQDVRTVPMEPEISIKDATDVCVDLNIKIGPEDLSYYLKILSRPVEIAPAITQREREVLLHMADGLGIKEISRKMNVAESTVITHRKNLMAKTQTRNGIELIVFCIRNGII